MGIKKSCLNNSYFSGFAAILLTVAAVSNSSAATITWTSTNYINTGSAKAEMGTGQFNQTGTFDYAENCGGSATTFDGISFSAPSINFGGTYSGFHANNASNDVSKTGTYGSGAQTVTLGSGGVGTIVAGNSYRVQLFFMDGRSSLKGRTAIVDGVNQGVYANGISGVTWGDGLLVTGTFTADSNSQTFTVATSAGSQLNALVLYKTASGAAWDGEGVDSLWTTAGNWSDDLAPSSGKNYWVFSAQTIQTPDASSVTFAGDSLNLRGGSTLKIYRSDGSYSQYYTINGLTLDSSTLLMDGPTGTKYYHINSAVTFSGDCTLDLRNGPGYTGRFHLDGAISGSGTMSVYRDASGTGREIYITGDASGYSGDWSIKNTYNSEAITVYLNHASGWGSGSMRLYANMKLQVNTAVSSSSSILSLDTAATLNLANDMTIGILWINGNSVAPGTYTAAQLTALGYGGTFTGSGSLTVSSTPTTITWDGGGANNYWSTAENWSNDEAPSLAHAYIVDGSSYTVENQTKTSTFDGGSLSLTNGAKLTLWRRDGNVSATFNSVALHGASLVINGDAYSTTYTLNSSLVISGNNTVDMRYNPGYSGYLHLNGAISGSGGISVLRDASGTGRNLYIEGDTSGYSGDWSVSSTVSEVLNIRLDNGTNGWGSGNMTLGNYAYLYMPTTGMTALTSTLTVGSNATLDLRGGAHTVAKLMINGTRVPPGTYTAAELTALGYGGTFTDSVGGGTISIPAYGTAISIL